MTQQARFVPLQFKEVLARSTLNIVAMRCTPRGAKTNCATTETATTTTKKTHTLVYPLTPVTVVT